MTVTLVRPEGPVVSTAAPTGPRRWLAAGHWDSPRRLTAVLVGLVVLALSVGVVGLTGVRQRTGLIDGVTSRSGALVVAAQDLYRALSDADATAASGFLSGGVEPASLRDRYQAGVADAGAALAVIAAGRAGDSGRDEALAVIAGQLPVYTGLVETARAYNRQGLPLGAAYLREASGLMREHVLPAAQRLYVSVSAELDRARAGGGGFPWFAVLLGILTIATLGYAQVWLTRRTNRMFNVGLVVATVAALVLVGWLTTSALLTDARLAASERDGSAQVDRLVQARVAVLQARAAESLTLVARGSGGDFERDYTAVMRQLVGPEGRGGLLRQAADQASDQVTRETARTAETRVGDWYVAHRKVRALDDNGQYNEAVAAAVGRGPDATTAIFNEVDSVLAKAISHNGDRFTADARAARRALTGLDLGVISLVVLMVGGMAVGLQRRIAEYR